MDGPARSQGVTQALAAAAAPPADRVYDSIYAAVLDHRLAPGARLREEELAETFGVSRTVVRQALHRLAQEQVVVLRPNRGAQVSEPTRRDGEHVFDARRVVECEVVRRLAGSLGDAQLATLQRTVDAEDEALATLDKQEAIRLSGQFHLQLAQLSGNPIFTRLLEALLPTTSLLMALYKAPGQPMCVAHSHRRLLAVLQRGATGAAVAEMKRHLNEIEHSLSQPSARAAPALRDVFKPYRDPP